MLRTDNSLDFQTRLPLEDLSNTFKDTIHVARYLGFAYLWIDSLCIVQDDHDDWARESLLMISVYGNASLNIAAAGAEDGSQGCFWNRPPIRTSQMQRNDGISTFTYDCISSLEVAQYGKTLALAPLHNRGWVLQERILSRRTLHFTRSEIFWECDEKFCSELFPQGCPPSITARLREMGEAKEKLTVSGWPGIIHRYSRTRLTYNSDRLIAIAGIAQLVETARSDRYVCGMWRSALCEQLCWFTDKPGQRIMPYNAPSWSWASLDTSPHPIAYHAYIDTDNAGKLVDVADVEIINASDNSFGDVLSATLRLSCKSFLPVQIALNTGPTSGSGGDNTLCIHLSQVHASIWLDCLVLIDECPTTAFMVPFWIGEYNGSYLPGFAGLLLEADRTRQGQYRRLGYCEVNTERNVINPEWQVGESDCIETRIIEDGSKRYIIDMI